jgi:hypothetical protein
LAQFSLVVEIENVGHGAVRTQSEYGTGMVTGQWHKGVGSLQSSTSDALVSK